jgi:MFS family permease
MSIAGGAGSLIGGKLADHMGRKFIMITFQTLSALLLGACGFLGDSMLVPKLLIVGSFLGSIAGPANGAMVMDLTTPENRQQSMSFIYLGMNIGVAVGPLMAGFLFEHYTRWLFWGDMITSLLALSLVMIFVKDTLPGQQEIDEIDRCEERAREKSESRRVFAALWGRPFLLVFCLITVITSFIYAQFGFSIPLHLTDLYGVEDGAIQFGIVTTINALVVVFLTTFLMVRTRRNKPIFNVAMASLTYAIGFGMMFFEISPWWFYLATVVWTLGEIIASVNINVYVANHSPVTHRGRFNSIYGIIQGTGGAVAPWLTGMFIVSAGIRWVWPLIFVLAAVSMIGFIILGKAESRSHHGATVPAAETSGEGALDE